MPTLPTLSYFSCLHISTCQRLYRISNCDHDIVKIHKIQGDQWPTVITQISTCVSYPSHPVPLSTIAVSHRHTLHQPQIIISCEFTQLSPIFWAVYVMHWAWEGMDKNYLVHRLVSGCVPGVDDAYGHSASRHNGITPVLLNPVCLYSYLWHCRFPWFILLISQWSCHSTNGHNI